MRLVKLKDAIEESEFGGKAANLAKGIKAELPVPDGFALNTVFVNKILEKNTLATNNLKSAFEDLNSMVAVRSSATGEDSKNASFAGQYLTMLNINSFEQLIEAIESVANSALEISVLDYREKLGLAQKPQMAIVVQKLIDVKTAGVLFTRNPITQAKEFLVEASWGIGEAVVAGLVIPDFFKLNIDGELVESKIGIKDKALNLNLNGGLDEVSIDKVQAVRSSLTNNDLKNLYQLANACKSVYGDDLDIEWGITNGKVHLLQCRSITT
ncbi:MAG: PEP/pyruvate-binding domain-containing protein [Gammaproteobacteria bacterium]